MTRKPARATSIAFVNARSAQATRRRLRSDTFPTGIVTAAFLARLMSAMLFAVAPTDVVTYASVSLLLILVALIACYVPARRATKRDPLIALRAE